MKIRYITDKDLYGNIRNKLDILYENGHLHSINVANANPDEFSKLIQDIFSAVLDGETILLLREDAVNNYKKGIYLTNAY